MRLLRDWAPPALLLVAALLGWQAVCDLGGVPAFLVPSPSVVAETAWAQRAVLLRATGVTAAESLAGFVSAALLGTGFAFVMTRARWLERSLVPYAVFLQTVPVVAIAPLLVLWLGIGFQAVAAASFIVAVFPMINAAAAGLRSVEPEHRALFRLYGASRWATFARLEVPSALPYLFAGLRTSSGLAVIGAVVGEFVAGNAAGDAGLGTLVLASNRQMATALMFAAVLCSSGLGLALFGAVSAAAWASLGRWHASAQAG